jgi:hypothetical protein
MRRSHIFFLFFALSFFGLYWIFRQHNTSQLGVKQIHFQFNSVDAVLRDTQRFDVLIVNFSDSIEAKLNLTGSKKANKRRLISKRRVGEILSLIEQNAIPTKDSASAIRIQQIGGSVLYCQLVEEQKIKDYFIALFELKD